jgi:Leucine-rich repeat (LRR) protein
VTTIEAKYCSIRKIPENAFNNLQQLKAIHLSNNRIESLSEGLFDNLINLEDLQLDYNQIYEIPKYLFNKVHNLESLYLYNNKIRKIPESVFHNLTNFKFLALDHNRINQISSDTFDNLSNLSFLGLSSNQMSEIDENLFKNLVNLQILSLSYNRISTLNDYLFKNLINLEELYLNNNKISRIPKSVFNKLKNLQSLSLSGNQIKAMELWPTLLPSIKFINLTYNQIERFSNEHHWFLNNSANLGGLSAKIDLQFNNICSLDDNTVEQYGVCSHSEYTLFLHKYFRMFDINNNPIICNCENSKYLISFVRGYSELKKSALLDSKCMLPKVYTGKSLTNFDSCNSSIDYSRCTSADVTESATNNETLSSSTIKIIEESTIYSTTASINLTTTSSMISTQSLEIIETTENKMVSISTSTSPNPKLDTSTKIEITETSAKIEPALIITSFTSTFPPSTETIIKFNEKNELISTFSSIKNSSKMKEMPKIRNTLTSKASKINNYLMKNVQILFIINYFSTLFF